MKLYHTTSPASAARILDHGFTEDEGPSLTDRLHCGVRVCEHAVAEAREVVLELTVRATTDDLSRFAWTDGAGSNREWMIPAPELERILETIRRTET